MKRILFIISAIFCINAIQAQEPADALRYAMTTQGGTARSRAIGGATNALGGDLGAGFNNPAALGFFRTNEFVFTPSLSFGNSSSKYLGTEKTGKYSTPDLNNLAVVISKPGAGAGNVSYGFGMNKSLNFSNKITSSGLNNQSSYSERYLEELINNNVTDPNSAARDFPFGSSLAFNTFLIDTVRGIGNAIKGYRSLATPQTGVLQEQDITTKGSINDMFFAIATSVQDRIYLGGSLIFSRIRFDRTSKFKESDATKKSNFFNYFTADEYLTTDGVGVGVRLGLILKPIDPLRVGFNFQSPIFYNMDDTYSTVVSADLEGYQGNGILTQSSDDLNDGLPGNYQYNYTTPLKMGVGFSYVLGAVEQVGKQKGFISADLEYIDYSKSKFKSMDGDGTSYLNVVNTGIGSQFKSAINLRAGGELKFNTLMVRAGINLMGNAYSDAALNASRTSISGGIGYRDKGYFMDLTYVHQLSKDVNYPYTLDNGFYAPSFIQGNSGMLMATFGFKF